MQSACSYIVMQVNSRIQIEENKQTQRKNHAYSEADKITFYNSSRHNVHDLQENCSF